MAQATKQAMQQKSAATSTGTQAEGWVQGAEQGLAFARKHRGALLGTLAALALVLVAGTWAFVHQRSESREASAAFANALNLLDRPSDEDRKARFKARAERDRALAEAERAEAAEAAENDGHATGTEKMLNRSARAPTKSAEDDSAEEMEDSLSGAATNVSAAQRRAAMAEAERDAERAEDEEAERSGIPRFATNKERDLAGQAALLAVAGRYPKLAVGTLAALEAAALAAKNGEQATADATYARLWAELPISDTFKPVVAQRYAESKKRAGDPQAALEALGRISQSETRFLADEAAMERVYLLEAQGETAKASAELEDMAVKFPDSALQDEIRAELAALAAEATQSAAVTSPDTVEKVAPTAPARAHPMIRAGFNAQQARRGVAYRCRRRIGALVLVLAASTSLPARAQAALEAPQGRRLGAQRIEPTAQKALFARWRRPIVRTDGDRQVIDSLGTPALVPARRARRNCPAAPGMAIVGTAEGAVMALSTESGGLLWRYRHNVAIDGVVSLLSAHDLGEGSGTYPVLAVVCGRDSELLALDVATGTARWRARLDAPSRAGIVSCNGRLFVTTEANQVVALRARTGEVLWSQGRPSSTGLALLGHDKAAIEGERVFAAFSDGFVMAMAISDGQVLWERPLSLQGGRFVDADADPAVVNGRLFVASITDGVFALGVEAGHTLWHQPLPEVLSLATLNPDNNPGKECPSQPARAEKSEKAAVLPESSNSSVAPSKSALSTPLIVAGDVYGKVRAFAQEDGRPIWRMDAGAGPAASLTPYLDGLSLLAGSHGLLWLDAATGRPRSLQALGGMPGGGLSTDGELLTHVGRGGALFLWQGQRSSVR